MPNSGDDEVDLGDMVSGVVEQDDSRLLSNLTGVDILDGSLDQLHAN